MNIKVGDIVTIKSESTRYRIVAIAGEYVILCRLDTTKFDLIEIALKTLLRMISDDSVEIGYEDKDAVFDYESFPDTAKERFYMKRNVFREIDRIYGPCYLGLCGKTNKKELYEVLEKNNYSKTAFWRDCLKYFQSGFDDRTLFDTKYLGINKGKEYSHNSKSGRKSEYGDIGVALSQDVLDYFEEALRDYKSGRQKSIKSCYDSMNMQHFSATEVINGVPTITFLPANKRPTYKQFYNYVHKNLSQQEKDIIKTSQMEFRNNKRLLTSDSLFGVNGPGDLVEIDACEADVSLVSVLDSNQTVGRPIVYFMIDVYTRVIIAVSIAFDNNSLLGVTNLFLNLCDDKKEFCEKSGISFSDDRLWPSNIIPNRIRVDRGSEFKSKEFGRICNALGIQKDIVPGGSGSLKGVVEQSFRLMHLNQNESLENYGLIEKRYDSNHHKEATLNIDQYTKMVINFILSHNQKHQENYPLTKDMLDKRIEPVPAMLWQYGIENIATPRPIMNINQYLYELMTPINVSVSRKGISYKGLYYLSDDPEVSTLMFKAKNKKIPLEAKIDMRDVGNIYWLKGDKLIQIPLNDRIAGNADYAGMTMKQYEDYRRIKGELSAKGRIYNEELAAYTQKVNKVIVKEAADESKSLSNDKNMRSAREQEKQLVSSENTIKKRLKTKKVPKIEEKAPEIEETTPSNEKKGIEKEVKDFFNLTEEELKAEQQKALAQFEDEDW